MVLQETWICTKKTQWHKFKNSEKGFTLHYLFKRSEMERNYTQLRLWVLVQFLSWANCQRFQGSIGVTSWLTHPEQETSLWKNYLLPICNGIIEMRTTTLSYFDHFGRGGFYARSRIYRQSSFFRNSLNRLIRFCLNSWNFVWFTFFANLSILSDLHAA